MWPAVHENAAVRALHLHASVPCGRLRALRQGRKPDMPLRQGTISFMQVYPTVFFCGIHEATAEQDNCILVPSTKPIDMQGRLRPAALASKHQHRCVQLSSQAPLCHVVRCKPLQCLLLGSGMLLKLSQLTESLPELPKGF